MCQCLGGTLIMDGGNGLNHENVIDKKKAISCIHILLRVSYPYHIK
jgi:hypothetical protein